MECKKIIFSLGLLFSFLIVNAQLYTYPEDLRTGIPAQLQISVAFFCSIGLYFLV